MEKATLFFPAKLRFGTFFVDCYIRDTHSIDGPTFVAVTFLYAAIDRCSSTLTTPRRLKAIHLMSMIELLIYPINQAALVALAGLIFLCRRRYRSSSVLFVLSLSWIWFCATPACATWLRNPLEQAYPQKNAAAYPKADVIVVLGGGTLPQRGVDWNVDDVDTQATRLGFGLQLFQNARADVILLSGGDQALSMARRLRRQGVPATALLTENTSANTHENALYSAAMLKPKQWQRILLVTSGIHMPRAAAAFTREGLDVIPAPAHDPVYPSWQAHPWWPNRAALRLSGRCLREYVGLWWYRWHDWAS